MPNPAILSSAGDAIAQLHMERIGPRSAEAITDKLLDTIELLGGSPQARSEEALSKSEPASVGAGSCAALYDRNV